MLREQKSEVGKERVKKGDAGQLHVLFSLLVQRLLKNLTLFCVIGGNISHYDMSYFEDSRLNALETLLDLAKDSPVPVAVKTPITSTATAYKVQRRFKIDGA